MLPLSYWNAPELSFTTKFQGLFLRYTGVKTGNFSLSATVYARHIENLSVKILKSQGQRSCLFTLDFLKPSLAINVGCSY